MALESQRDRRLRLTTPLGDDALLIERFTGDEEISRPFRYELDLFCADAHIDFKKIVAQNVTVEVDDSAAGRRLFNGFVSEFAQIESKDQLARYRAVVVPWLWYLTRVADCRIFQAKSIPEILEEVFISRNFTQFELRLVRSYSPLEFCVQYRETDFNFVSRLMENEGIYYHFVHEEGGHKLIMMDSMSAHDANPAAPKATYMPWQEKMNLAGIRTWMREERVCPGAFAHTDFNFKSPRRKLLTDVREPKPHDHSRYEIYEYPGNHLEREVGESYATIRIQELQAEQETYRGEADLVALETGFMFTLEGAYRQEDNCKYLLTRLRHEIHSTPFISRADGDQATERFYLGSLLAVPASIEFRPRRLTPRPLITGPQTAIVTGPRGEEIYTDEYGRIKVHFHWHRHDKSDDKSSCWIRVSQNWAGKQWGAMHIPRIGQEVIVEFLEGDPDRPIVTGRVYNGDSMPPYSLPANKTQSGMKSRSSPGGGGSDFNEIRMEDKKGSEQLYVHAQKNQDNVVENDESTAVGRDRGENVGRDETISIGRNRTETVGKNETITIGNDRAESVGHNETITIANDRTDAVGKNESRSVAVDRSRQVGNNETVVIGNSRAVNVGSNHTETIGANQTLNVGSTQTTTVGGNKVETVAIASAETVGAVKALSVGAGYQVTVGASMNTTVALTQTEQIGLVKHTLVGSKYVIEVGSASITLESGGKVTINGTELEFTSSGPVKINGVVVDIN